MPTKKRSTILAKKIAAPKKAAPKGVLQKNQEDTSKRILTAATKLFDSKGFEGASIKDISTLAKVNIAAINYHFGSKEQLLQHIIETYGKFRLELVQRVLSVPESKEELRVRLEMFLHESLEAFVAMPEVCRIVQKEVEHSTLRSEKIFKKTFLLLIETLSEFIRQVQKKGLMRKELNPLITSRVLCSQISHATRMDPINKKYFGSSIQDDAYRNTWVREILSVFLDGTAAFRNET